MIVRNVRIADASRLLEIYAPYVEETAISFEVEAPTLEEFETRISDTAQKYPYIVVEDNGLVVGYAYAHELRSRAAFKYSVETSIYVDRQYKRNGLGRLLYENLEKELVARGFHRMYACVTFPIGEDPYLTTDSVRFHERVGFKECAHLHECGYKFDRWYDMLYLEKKL